ncbi:MAG: TRAP transporter small permease [Rhodospirillaceae bacterium]|nr:TRAP transporter small permease [Rhodospirillaceae bacterium]
MDALFRLSGLASWALAQLGKLCLAATMILIVVDVAIRNLGGRPPIWTIPICEYLLLYIAALGIPYLARRKGHVLIEIVVRGLSSRLRPRWERAIGGAAAAVLLYLAIVAAGMTRDAAVTGDFQIRAINMPAWIAYLPFALGFALGAVEFLRYAAGRDSLFDRRAEETDSL